MINSCSSICRQPNSANGEESGRCAEIEESLPDLDLTIELFLMLSYSADESRPGEIAMGLAINLQKDGSKFRSVFVR